MRHALLAALALTALSACQGYEPYLPDGGRALLNCTGTPTEVPVVVKRLGEVPTDPVTMTAVNLGDGSKRATGTTNGAGVYRVSEELGPGVVKVSGTLNDLKTAEGHFTFTCGECDCVVSPRELFLSLE